MNEEFIEELKLGFASGNHIAINVLTEASAEWHVLYINSESGIQKDAYIPTARFSRPCEWSDEL